MIYVLMTTPTGLRRPPCSAHETYITRSEGDNRHVWNSGCIDEVVIVWVSFWSGLLEST